MINPTTITPHAVSGYRRKVFSGWKRLDEATINGEGYSFEFFRYGAATIDRNCDALNGWYTCWTDYRIDYRDSEGELSLTVKDEKAVSILFSNVCALTDITDEEGRYTAQEQARDWMNSLIGLIDFLS